MAQSASTRRSSLLLALGSVAYLALMFVWFSLPAFLLPITADLSLTTAQAGFLTGAIPLSYIPLSVASGVIVDRIGPRRSVGIALLIFGVAQIARGYATDFWSMLLPTLLLGVGGTGITFGLPKLISAIYPAERVGSASSVYMIGSYLGVATAFSLGRGVLGPVLGGWRPVFLWGGVAAFAFGGCWFLVTLRVAGDGLDAPPESERTAAGTNVRAVLTTPGMVSVIVIGTMYLLILHGIQGWLATVLESRGVAPAMAATITSGMVGAQILGALAIPLVVSRTSYRAIVLGCGVLATAGTLGLWLPGLGGSVAVVGSVVVGIAVGALSPLVRAIPVELDGVGPELTGTAVGLVFTVGEIGGFLGPFLIGSLETTTGSFAPGLALLTVGSLVILGAGATLST
ncbi:CynX/NimT family MFS transporter [Haladaptatus sp. GCM10025707]|uniref:MFS transporter n=1 Tax=unclassified Haladaptatus TaxID=2622732 RepID=UPI0023E8AD38|nr:MULTISPECIES: MFS transporter [unclassified Haladaptatus]